MNIYDVFTPSTLFRIHPHDVYAIVYSSYLSPRALAARLLSTNHEMHEIACLDSIVVMQKKGAAERYRAPHEHARERSEWVETIVRTCEWESCVSGERTSQVLVHKCGHEKDTLHKKWIHFSWWWCCYNLPLLTSVCHAIKVSMCGDPDMLSHRSSSSKRKPSSSAQVSTLRSLASPFK